MIQMIYIQMIYINVCDWISCTTGAELVYRAAGVLPGVLYVYQYFVRAVEILYQILI